MNSLRNMTFCGVGGCTGLSDLDLRCRVLSCGVKSGSLSLPASTSLQKKQNETKKMGEEHLVRVCANCTHQLSIKHSLPSKLFKKFKNS